MATTLKIANGDVIINTSTGRPKLIGNAVGENDTAKSREKTVQDIRGSLSIARNRNGTGAGISELVGRLQGNGINSVPILLNKRIRDMFSNILRLQRRRLNIRPASERFTRISFLQIFRDKNAPTNFRFRLDVKTSTGETLTQSGTVG